MRNCIIIPILDESNAPVNLVGYSIYPQRKPRTISLHDEGIFNGRYLSHVEDVLFTQEPLEALALIEREIANVTFLQAEAGRFQGGREIPSFQRLRIVSPCFINQTDVIEICGFTAQVAPLLKNPKCLLVPFQRFRVHPLIIINQTDVTAPYSLFAQVAQLLVDLESFFVPFQSLRIVRLIIINLTDVIESD